MRLNPPKPKQPRGIARPQRLRGEDFDAYGERIKPWDGMMAATVEMKNAASRTATALEIVDALLNRSDGSWSRYEIPANQRAHVEQWRQALADASAALGGLDVDAWKPEVAQAVQAAVKP